MVEVNGRFQFEKDTSGWQLHDWKDGEDKKGNPIRTKKTTYHSNLKQICSVIIDRSAGQHSSLQEIATMLENAETILIRRVEEEAAHVGNMESGILDKNGKEIKEGDSVAFPYIDPLGNVCDDVDFVATVIFKHGCFGYDRPNRFVPLLDWSIKAEGEYVPNMGVKEIISDKYLFWVIEK
jgi:hypothetical protein